MEEEKEAREGSKGRTKGSRGGVQKGVGKLGERGKRGGRRQGRGGVGRKGGEKEVGGKVGGWREPSEEKTGGRRGQENRERREGWRNGRTTS